MTATPAAFIITDEQLADAEAPSFDSLEVPGDYEAVLVKVEDYDKTAEGKTKGWIFHFRVEGLPFKVWVAHSDAARWKLIETIHAFEPGFFEVRNPDGSSRPVDPMKYLNMTVGAHVVLDESMDTPMKTIDYLFSLAESEPEVSDVPIL